jgi:hypothetical protein
MAPLATRCGRVLHFVMALGPPTFAGLVAIAAGRCQLPKLHIHPLPLGVGVCAALLE